MIRCHRNRTLACSVWKSAFFRPKFADRVLGCRAQSRFFHCTRQETRLDTHGAERTDDPGRLRCVRLVSASCDVCYSSAFVIAFTIWPELGGGRGQHTPLSVLAAFTADYLIPISAGRGVLLPVWSLERTLYITLGSRLQFVGGLLWVEHPQTVASGEFHQNESAAAGAV